MDFVDLLLHSDKYLLDLVQTYGAWIHGILFLIVFAETGLVVTPFLPGDSLLFALGAAKVPALAIFNNTEFLLLTLINLAQTAVAYQINSATLMRTISPSG